SHEVNGSKSNEKKLPVPPIPTDQIRTGVAPLPVQRTSPTTRRLSWGTHSAPLSPRWSPLPTPSPRFLISSSNSLHLDSLATPSGRLLDSSVKGRAKEISSFPIRLQNLNSKQMRVKVRSNFGHLVNHINIRDHDDGVCFLEFFPT